MSHTHEDSAAAFDEPGALGGDGAPAHETVDDAGATMTATEGTTPEPSSSDMALAAMVLASAERARRRRRVLRWAGIGLAACGVFACGVLIGGVVLARQMPSWYQTLDPRDPLVIASARRIENAVATALTRIRTTPAASGGGGSGGAGSGGAATPSTEMFTLALSATDANAWLAVRLPGWLAHECDPPMDWPSEVSGVRVGFDSGRIHMGAGLAGGEGGHGAEAEAGSPRVLTASVRPQFADNGALWTPATSMGIGRLSMPAGLVLRGTGLDTNSPEQMPASVAEMSQTKDVIAALRGQRPTLSQPIIRIGDGRRIRLVAIEARDGKLYITCQPLMVAR